MPIWTETVDVPFDEGYFSLQLGAVTPFDATTFDGSTRYLGITIQGESEMSPRAEVASVPYAMFANDVNGDIHPNSVSIQAWSCGTPGRPNWRAMAMPSAPLCRPVWPTFRDGLAVSQIIETAFQASDSGQWHAVPQGATP